MPRRKTSQQQKRRIQHRQQQLRQQAHADTTESEHDVATGIVIAHQGKNIQIEDAQGQLWNCHLRPHIEKPVCGDRVAWQQEGGQHQGVILALQPRQTELARHDGYGRRKVIAANVDQAMIVFAPKPDFNEEVIDRYLVALENSDIAAVLVFNKIDLLEPRQQQDALQRLGIYEKLDYPLIQTSAKQDHGLDSLIPLLQDKTSVFIGQSGVGKSSIAQTLLPDESIRIGKLSRAQGEGRHTTTTAQLYTLPHGGRLIDSPGIRDFALGAIDQQQLANGFREFHQYLGQCRFRNCQHRHERDCAIQEAVRNGNITEQRWQSYCRIAATLTG